MRRRGHPLLAALPAVAILAASLAFAREQLFYLVPAFGAVLGLLAWSQYTRRSQDWQRHSVDYATDIPFDLTLWAGAIVVVVGGLALVAAVPSPHQAVRLTRGLLITRSQTAENLGQSLGLSPGAGQARPLGKPGGLPRQHLLGSGPELSQRVIYLARVFEPAGGLATSGESGVPVEERLYWQAVTYDIYDGRGWSTSPTSPNPYAGGEGPPFPEQLSSYYWIEQEIQAVGDAGRQVVQAGDLSRLDQPFAVDLRIAPPGELDVFGARLDHPPRAGSTVPSPGCWLPARRSWPRPVTITRYGSPNATWRCRLTCPHASRSWRTKSPPGKPRHTIEPKPSKPTCASSHTRSICLPRRPAATWRIITCSICAVATATMPPPPWRCWRVSWGCRPGWWWATRPVTMIPTPIGW